MYELHIYTHIKSCLALKILYLNYLIQLSNNSKIIFHIYSHFTDETAEA